MFTTEKFFASILYKHGVRPAVARVFASAFSAVEPGAAVKEYLSMHPLPKAQRIFSFGLGKAAVAMTSALAQEISLTNSLVITKHASPINPLTVSGRYLGPVTVIEGDHPIPGNSSMAAGVAAIKFISELEPGDLLVCLISGGGSALMIAPRIPLVDLQFLTTELLACGARIDEINILRRHLDLLKGGGVARSVVSRGAQIVGLLLSDVVNDSMETIASGPTAPDPASCADAVRILEKYNLKNRISSSIVPALTETLKLNDPIFINVHNTIVASNEIALLAAEVQAQKESFKTLVIRKDLQGEASIVGREIGKQLQKLCQTMKRPFCLLAGGETTVTLKGKGKGGRNQELALGAVDVLAGMKDVVLISLATDGEDGPTDAAGAIVTGESAQRAESLGMFAADYLSTNDAYSYFEALNDLVQIGPSGTNVNDLIICFAF